MSVHLRLSRLTFSTLVLWMSMGILVSPTLGVPSPGMGPDPGLQIISIEIPSEESTVYPGMTIHPTITVHNADNQTEKQYSIRFFAKIGPVPLLLNNTCHDVPGAGESREYQISGMIPFIQPGTYALTVSGEQNVRTEQRGIVLEQIRSKTMVEVKPPRSETGTKMCNCR